MSADLFEVDITTPLSSLSIGRLRGDTWLCRPVLEASGYEVKSPEGG